MFFYISVGFFNATKTIDSNRLSLRAFQQLVFEAMEAEQHDTHQKRRLLNLYDRLKNPENYLLFSLKNCFKINDIQDFNIFLPIVFCAKSYCINFMQKKTVLELTKQGKEIVCKDCSCPSLPKKKRSQTKRRIEKITSIIITRSEAISARYKAIRRNIIKFGKKISPKDGF